MKSNYRETKNDIVSCPFNPNHKVKRCRLITHKKICPDKEIKGFVQCPYNPNHHVTIENLEKHKAKCPNKIVINSDLEKEMEDFLKNKKNEKGITKEVEGEEKHVEGRENTRNKQLEIEGIKTKKKKNKNKTKKSNEENKNKTKNEEIQEKSIDLESMTNKELFNFIFNDNMVIEYHSDSSENNDEDDDEKKNGEINED